MKDRKKPDKFLPPHGMPSDGCEFAFSSRVPPKALTIKIPYTSWNYQYLPIWQRALPLPTKAGWYAVLEDPQMPATSTLLDQAHNAIVNVRPSHRAHQKNGTFPKKLI